MPKRARSGIGGGIGKKARGEEDGVEAVHAIPTEQAAVAAQPAAAIAQRDAALAQHAAVIDEFVPHSPSDVWAESHFEEHVMLRWTPRATGIMASELVIGAIDEATRECLDDLGRATSDAIGACVVDARLVAGRKLRFFEIGRASCRERV